MQRATAAHKALGQPFIINTWQLLNNAMCDVSPFVWCVRNAEQLMLPHTSLALAHSAARICFVLPYLFAPPMILKIRRRACYYSFCIVAEMWSMSSLSHCGWLRCCRHTLFACLGLGMLFSHLEVLCVLLYVRQCILYMLLYWAIFMKVALYLHFCIRVRVKGTQQSWKAYEISFTIMVVDGKMVYSPYVTCVMPKLLKKCKSKKKCIQIQKS